MENCDKMKQIFSVSEYSLLYRIPDISNVVVSFISGSVSLIR
jgi:hypothetical protein